MILTIWMSGVRGRDLGDDPAMRIVMPVGTFD
jgi:hypothetical protein